jgi:hypothetical protein
MGLVYQIRGLESKLNGALIIRKGGFFVFAVKQIGKFASQGNRKPKHCADAHTSKTKIALFVVLDGTQGQPGRIGKACLRYIFRFADFLQMCHVYHSFFTLYHVKGTPTTKEKVKKN